MGQYYSQQAARWDVGTASNVYEAITINISLRPLLMLEFLRPRSIRLAIRQLLHYTEGARESAFTLEMRGLAGINLPENGFVQNVWHDRTRNVEQLGLFEEQDARFTER